MAFDQKLSWVVRKNLGERVLMQLMFVILVEQSENQAKDFGILDWSVSLWLTVIEMKMIRQMLEVKEGLTWVRTMEVAIWSIMNVASMMMIIVTIVVIIRPAMFQSLVLRIWCFRFQLGEGDLFDIVPYLKACLEKSSMGLGAWKSYCWIFCNSFLDKHWSY